MMRAVLFVVADLAVMVLAVMITMPEPVIGHVGRMVPVEEEPGGQADAHETVTVPETKPDVAP